MKLKLELEEGKLTLVCRKDIDKAIVKQTKVKQVSPKVIEDFAKYVCILDNKLQEANRLFIGLITKPEGFFRIGYKDVSLQFELVHKGGAWWLVDITIGHADYDVGMKSLALSLDQYEIVKEAQKKLGKVVYFG